MSWERFNDQFHAELTDQLLLIGALAAQALAVLAEITPEEDPPSRDALRRGEADSSRRSDEGATADG